jgi:hypothetical protein
MFKVEGMIRERQSAMAPQINVNADFQCIENSYMAGNAGKGQALIEGTWSNGLFSTDKIVSVQLTGTITGSVLINSCAENVPSKTETTISGNIEGVICTVHTVIKHNGLHVEVYATRLRPPRT